MDRDTILTSFQEISQIQNFEECIQILESVNWDLQLAVDSMDQATHLSTTESSVEHNFMSFSPINANRHFNPVIRALKFNVDVKGKSINVNIHEDKTVGDLSRLVAHEINEPNTRLNINGLKTPYNEHTFLITLKLPLVNNVVATVIESKTPVSAGSSTSRAVPSNQYHFKIQIYINNEFSQILPLTFIGRDSIGKVKSHIAYLTGTETANQTWTSWPCCSNPDEMILEDCVISEENGCNQTVFIRVEDSQTPQLPVQEYRSPSLEISANNSREIDNEDFEDFDDFTDDVDLADNDAEVQKKPSAALMDANAHLDPVAAVIKFNTEFTKRYCSQSSSSCQQPPAGSTSRTSVDNMSPPFFLGSLDDALSSTLNLPPHERKPLFLYLHHGESIQANIFCTQILCYSEICLFFLQSEYFIWPWDVTYSENKSQLMSWVTRSLGAYIASNLRIISKDQYPVIVVISKAQGAIEVLEIIDGMRTKEQTVSHLWNINSQFQEKQKPDQRAWEERALRDLVKQEQDLAYQESLLQDQQKEQQRSVEVEKQREGEQRAHRELERTASEKRARIVAAAKSLPSEPAEDEADTITIRLRAPANVDMATDMTTRRFRDYHTLGHLIAYMESLGFLSTEFKLLTTYPRKNLTEIEDRTMTLKQLGIPKRETLILEML